MRLRASTALRGATGPIALHKIVRLDVEASVRVPNDEPVDEIYALDCSCRSPDPLDIGF